MRTIGAIVSGILIGVAGCGAWITYEIAKAWK